MTKSDSMVHGPFEDFRLMYSNRVVDRSMRRSAAMVIVGLNRQITSLNNDKAILLQKNDRLEDALNRSSELLLSAQVDLIECNESITPYKGWATFGKGTAAAGGLYILYKFVELTIKPQK